MKTLITVSLLLSSAAAYCQSSEPFQTQHTRQLYGVVIGVEGPIVENVRVTEQCSAVASHDQREHSAFNVGTVIGTAAGAVVGKQFGKGSGNQAAIAVGAATGAITGNEINRNMNANRNQQQSVSCQPFFEQRVIGHRFVAEVNGLQVRGSMRGHVSVGQTVPIIVTSIYRIGEL